MIVADGVHSAMLVRPGYRIDTDSVGGPSLRSSDSFDIIDGARSMILYNDTDPMTFTLDAPSHAFAINFKDIDMQFGGTFLYSIDGGPFLTLLPASGLSNLDVFFGIIDTMSPFSTITFDRTSGDGYNFDLVNYQTSSSAVPEPSLLFLFAAGFVALGWRANER